MRKTEKMQIIFVENFFCIMCKNTYDTRKVLLLKDIPLGGCWPHT